MTAACTKSAATRAVRSCVFVHAAGPILQRLSRVRRSEGRKARN
jgi:hypothetical protein